MRDARHRSIRAIIVAREASVTLQQLRYVIAIEKSGSFSKAAKNLYVSQPSISALVKDLEEELCISIFDRTAKGITLTQDGKDLLKYAYRMIDQESYIQEYFRDRRTQPPIVFSVSSQHYSFVVELFAMLENSLQADRYALRLRQTITSAVISDVAKQRSEIGIIFRGDFNQKSIARLLKENNLSFHPLASTIPHIFVRRDHPFKGRESVSVEDLGHYPCIVYDQDEDIPQYYSEETILPGYEPAKVITVSDMFSCVFMMEKCDAYNIGTGLLPEHDAAAAYIAIPIRDQSPLAVGWIGLTNTAPSPLGERFISMLRSFLDVHAEGARAGGRGL
jgi:DNA-binding transcriptional LysR family regulator